MDIVVKASAAIEAVL